MKGLKEIGGIQIFAEIYQGATTLVFKGYQPALDRMVLLKVLRPEFNQDADLSRHFEEEARLTAKIQHPNVAAIYDYGRDGVWRYFGAEFVEGFNLGELIKQRNLPPDLAAFILLESTRGLKAAHDKDILHRDLKPSNILISHEGQVKLTDFGMASLRRSDEHERGEKVSGTLAYLAPERILGKPASQSSDLFSLGVTFFEMVTGEPAFTGENPADFFEAILHSDPFSKISSGFFPEKLRRICVKMLAKDSAQRYHDCDALIKEIEAASVAMKNADLKAYLLDPQVYVTKPIATSIAVPSRPVVTSTGRGWLLVAMSVLIVAMASAIGFSFLTKKEKIDLMAEQSAIVLQPADSIASYSDRGEFRKESMQKSEASQLEQKVETPAKTGTTEIVKSVAVRDSIQPAQNITEVAPSGFGYVSIACTPWATVFLNGDSVATTPMRAPIKLPVGRHELVLRNPEFPEFRETIELSDELTELEISLWSLVGTIKLEVSPWAEVFIDGEYKDTVPPQTRPLVLSPGQHRLTLKHPQLGSWETPIEIGAGKNLELKFNLKNLVSK
ncbi:MAG TPA: serine/threonine-protein kinase [bacterium]